MSNAHAISEHALLPFLKWAGGKRWFAERCTNLLPISFRRYIEPFVGSGALYFAMQPRTAILADLNADLINSYQAVRDEPTELERLLVLHDAKHSKEHYYQTRSNKPEGSVERAAWFIYLNRTCWNGLYRVNLRNEFNVPMGTKTRAILATDDFLMASTLLKSAQILVQDFEQTMDLAGEDDFVFVDPPYTVKHNLNGFVKYNDQIFSWSDQVRLREAVQRASLRGAKVLVTNANHHSIRELYTGVGQMTVLPRSSILAANSSHRSQVEELAISTWL